MLKKSLNKNFRMSFGDLHDISLEKVSITGVTYSIIDFEKSKKAYLAATTNSDYTITALDTWEKIAKKYLIQYESFLKIHNINGEIPPQPGKTIKIKKPIFLEIKNAEAQQPTQKSNERLNFKMELILTKDFFNENSVDYEDYNVGTDLEKRSEMIEKSGQMGVPVILISKKDGSEETIIGFDEDRIRQLLSL